MSNPPATRSYMGCWTCRRRRRKCDGQRPVCQNCEVRNLHCEGYDEALAQPYTPRRRRVGQTSLDSSRPASVALGQSATETIVIDGACPEVEKTQRSPSTNRPRTETAQARDLFRQFIETGCQELFSTKVLTGAFSSAIVDLCQDSQACYTVCIALQASLTDGLQRHFLEYFDLALQHFRSEFGQTDSLTYGTLTAGILIWPMIDELVEALGILDLSSFIIARRSPPMHIWYRHCRNGARSTPKNRPVPRSLVDLFSGVRLDASEDDFLHWPGAVGSFAQMHLWETYRYMGVLCIRRLRQQQGASSPENRSSAEMSESVH
ncbi:Zn(II)2Cys6 transcription factor domain-containing protein [Aspergillus affinis]|uniref:Zn(II)2Cys6 transcription factor domain-containing protein n=1 Tax=Aspergillus affinis TaxID=1070780 RepID=UPI0022FE65C1|nr:uncharacterized protein KD926_004647 [Aspergillus affinis]KAI9035082.1 hypothetical protein KD926_004647 [Aspergillus affinis]